MLTASVEALCHAEQAANQVLEAIPMCLCDGDELFRALVVEVGYGNGDERLRVFMRRVQKRIECEQRNG